MNYTLGQFNKLPKWAQDLVLELKRVIDEQAALIDCINKQSSESLVSIRLYNNSTTRFCLPKDSYIEVKFSQYGNEYFKLYHMDDGIVKIICNDSVAILPESSNAFCIKKEER